MSDLNLSNDVLKNLLGLVTQGVAAVRDQFLKLV